MTEMKSFKVNNLLKKVVAGVAALTMCISVMPLSANAEGYSTGTTTSIQQVSNDVYNQVLELGFDEDEAQYIVDHVDEDEISSILGTGNSNTSVKRSVSKMDYCLENPTYSNVKGWNTDNTCGSVAATIFLVYLSCYHIPEISYRSPKDLYNTLKGYIETGARNSTISSLELGIANYLNDTDDDDLNLGSQMRSVVDGTSEVNFKKMCLLTIAQLDDDHPVLVGGKYSSATTYGHVVVIEGIDIVNTSNGGVDTNNTYIYVNDGYGNTKQKINFKNFVNYNWEGIVYMF